MAGPGWLLALLSALGTVTLISGCFCDHYPWSAWSTCSKTCNYGAQWRRRAVHFDAYYWDNQCGRMCETHEARACNVEVCPVHCEFSEYGSWSECSPCAKKQFRTRAVARPAQFGGQECSEPLMEERPCHSAKECQIEPVNCKNQFKCDSGRCISPTLECNNQNDCGDNSDERNCARNKRVCLSDRVFKTVPGAELAGSGFDAVAEEMRGAVLDNFFMGDSCVLNRSRENREMYRIPANIESYELKVEFPEDFKSEDAEVKSDSYDIAKESSKLPLQASSHGGFNLLLFGSSRSQWSSTSSSTKNTVKASQQKDSKFFRVHQVLATSTFKTKQSDLYLSDPFLKYLHNLPLEYNYPLYREIFQQFGTHYFTSGTMGGLYDILYQYDREELKTSGMKEEVVKTCIRHQTRSFFLFFSWGSSSSTCGTNTVTHKYEGSFLKASEKSISRVKGGRAAEAAALSWVKDQLAPDSTIYTNWLKSTVDNPTVVEYELAPIVTLVRGIPCAVTKRRHMVTALKEYLQEFDSCKCAPCPNNARPVLSGAECLCVCQTGTYGANCEKRAPDYTSETVDGRWSCWGSWSPCGSTLKTHRSRQCNNPAPLRGGKPCDGPATQTETCYISIFGGQNVCINDNDFETEGDQTELPPGKGCLRPKPPANSRLRINKRQYDFGDHDEFLCFTGFELEGYQFIHCLPDGTWKPASGQCIKKVCDSPNFPAEIHMFPVKDKYRVGDSIAINCPVQGQSPSGPQYYTCESNMAWEPAIQADIFCKEDKPFTADSSCDKGQKRDASDTCVCIPREECQPYKKDLCILDDETGTFTMTSFCSFHSARCHGDRLFFVSDGPCLNDDFGLEWARYRAGLSERSSVQQACGSDTCYDWETCSSDTKKCECKFPRDCPKEGTPMFCLKMLKTQTMKSMNLCFMGAMKCKRMDFDVIGEGPCPSN
ncbi:complement component C6 [Denticeps clupeoides]|uniref:complement component C6 n=1 Tax=Denticeps clupeoides TaxID=299321 RepID=UPI0010A512BD|nr:complement component C6 [Denticeps clupeoides]